MTVKAQASLMRTCPSPTARGPHSYDLLGAVPAPYPSLNWVGVIWESTAGRSLKLRQENHCQLQVIDDCMPVLALKLALNCSC